MKSTLSRLDALEKALIPEERIAIFFSRDGHKQEDHARQLEEYKKLHGSTEKLIIIDMKDYIEDDYDDYEIFLRNRRAKCGKGNCFCWWSEYRYGEIKS